MKFRKVMSALLAGAMVLSMSATAFATSNVTDLSEGGEMEVTGTTHGATIGLTVPTSAALVVNPYKLTVDVPGGTSGTDTSADQVFSPVYYLENNSSLGIEVDVSMTGTFEGVTPVDTAAAAVVSDGAKNFFGFMELKATSGKTDPGSWTAAAAYAPGDTQIQLTDSAKTGKLKLAATDGDTATANDVMAFKFIGAANDKAGTAWTRDDVVSAAVTFTFKIDNGAGGGGGTTTYTISEGSRTDAGNVITNVSFEVGGSAATNAATGATVTIKVIAPTGNTISASIDGGTTSISLSDSATAGTYTGTFTMPSANASVDITVA